MAVKVLGSVGCLVSALVVELALLGRLPTPGGRGVLVLVVVLGFAFAQGPTAGLLLGFTGGLMMDLLSSHPLGLLALAFAFVGYFVGLTGAGEPGGVRDVIGRVVVAALGTVAATLLYAGGAALLGDPRVTGDAVRAALAGSVLYAVALAPLVVPAVAALTRRLDPEELP